MKIKSKESQLKLLVLLVISLVLASYYLIRNVQQHRLESSPTLVVSTQEQVEEQIESELVYQFEAQQEQTAWDLIQEQAKVEYDQYQAGIFITTVNGKKADQDHYWAFYVDDQYAQQAVDQTDLQPGNTVKLVYEQIDKSQFSQ